MNHPRFPQASLDLVSPDPDPMVQSQDPVVQDSIQAQILPFWHYNKRGMPNSILRSALFGVVARGQRKYQKRERIASIDGVEILYTGEQLDQSDLDAWQGLLSLSRQKRLGITVDFSIKQFLAMLNRSSGKTDREWLKMSITRMASTTVEIKQGDLAYGGSLIDEFYRDERTGRYVIVLNEKLVNLFQPSSWTAIDWDQRSALKGKQLAQWLHAFYSTHGAPFPYKVETLMRLSGSEIANERQFRYKLKKAFVEVCEVTGWQADISKDGLVTICKRPRIHSKPEEGPAEEP